MKRYNPLYTLREMAIRSADFEPGTDYRKNFDASFKAGNYSKFKKYPALAMKGISGTSHDRILVDMQGNPIDDAGNVKAKKTGKKISSSPQRKGLDQAVNKVLAYYNVIASAHPNEKKNALTNFVAGKKDEQSKLTDPIDKTLGPQIAAILQEIGASGANILQQNGYTAEDFDMFTTSAAFPAASKIVQGMKEKGANLETILEKRLADFKQKSELRDLYSEYYDSIVSYLGMGEGERASDMYIVISRRMIDFASQSTCQDWESCQHLGHGMYKAKVGSSFSEGAMVAYILNAEDIGPDLSWDSLNQSELHNAKARVLIKPSFPKDGEGHPFWYVDKVYTRQLPGGASAKFRQTVTQIFAKQNGVLPEGEYSISDAHYKDSGDAYDVTVDKVFRYVHAGDYSDMEKLPPEFLAQVFNRYPKMVVQHWDMSMPFPNISIDTLDLSNTDIRRLPKGIRANNYNLSGTNIETFAL